VLQLNASMRAILLIAIGIFMVGNALRMFNVHPIFRYFSIEPPKFITRYIRRKSKNSESFFGPLFLGALTVFIPCGVTQAMMAVAVGTGNALQGAVLMFAFILGTSPVFFVVAYLTMQLGSRLE
jgi:sulfite exporter TauE/SafE